MLRTITLLCTLLPALCVQAVTDTSAPQQEIAQLQQLRKELHQELRNLREQLNRLDQKQLEYLEQSQQLRRELLDLQSKPVAHSSSSGD